MLHALAAPIAENRRPEFMEAVTVKLKPPLPLRSGQALCIGPRARCCVIFGTAA